MNFLYIYLPIINALAFLLMRIDKQKAKKGRWRIPEATLLGISAIGGSLGGLLGMLMFRHKTKHCRFVFGIPLMLILHLALLIYFRNFLF